MDRYFSMGLLSIRLSWPDGETVIIDQAMENFSTIYTPEPDLVFSLCKDKPEMPESCREIFSTAPEGLWRILECPGEEGYVIALQNMERDRAPYKVVYADRGFHNFRIFSEPVRTGGYVPLEYPLDELAISGHLNLNRIGIILHSACISLEGRGILFSGTSGSGKSTLSELFAGEKDIDVLTDERVIIRKRRGGLWAFGTPWHGTAEIHRNAGTSINKIFFIKHGKENRIYPITKMDAANRLMVRCFPTFWNRRGMEFALDFCSRIAETIDCYELEFLPDRSVVGYVRDSLTW